MFRTASCRRGAGRSRAGRAEPSIAVVEVDGLVRPRRSARSCPPWSIGGAGPAPGRRTGATPRSCTGRRRRARPGSGRFSSPSELGRGRSTITPGQMSGWPRPLRHVVLFPAPDLVPHGGSGLVAAVGEPEVDRDRRRASRSNWPSSISPRPGRVVRGNERPSRSTNAESRPSTGGPGPRCTGGRAGTRAAQRGPRGASRAITLGPALDLEIGDRRAAKA